MLDSIQKLIASASTLIGIGVALWGFFRWRAELLARRRIELCEDVLTRLYEARDAIDGIRCPAVFGHEGESCPRVEGETAAARQRAKDAYVYYERFESRKAALEGLNALRYRFMAVYGPDWTGPFQTIVGIVNRIMTSAGLRRQDRDELDTYGDDGGVRANRNLERRERHDATLYKGYCDPDPIDESLRVAVQQIEDKCREEIRVSSSILYGLFRNQSD